MSRATLDQVVGPRAASNLLFVATSDDEASRRIATEVNARYLANGADAATIRSLVQEVAWRLIGTDAFGDDLPFSVPWSQLAVVIGLTLVFSLLATATPAQQASRIRPAVALRTTD